MSTFAFNYGVSLPKLADERWGGEGWFGCVLSVTSVGSFTGSLLTARLRWVSMRWYLGQHRSCSASAGIGMAWAPNLWRRPSLWAIPLGIGGGGFISAGNGDHPAGEPARHARPAAGAAGRGVPRLDPDRRPDHRL